MNGYYYYILLRQLNKGVYNITRFPFGMLDYIYTFTDNSLVLDYFTTRKYYI